MQQAVPVGVGAMAALLGVDIDQARDIASAASGHDEATGEDRICAAANDNAPGQVVVSGHKAAVEKAIAVAAERGFKRSIMLPVSAPFHCPLMQPAADAMAAALSEINLRAPVVPVIANVTAEPVADPIEIRGLLIEQVTDTVRWRESVLAMRARGVAKVAEFGAGKVLGGLVRRIDKEITSVSVGTPADVEAFLKG
jgi:[acyl-carrier-protein] S-malonyltransferase